MSRKIPVDKKPKKNAEYLKAAKNPNMARITQNIVDNFKPFPSLHFNK